MSTVTDMGRIESMKKIGGNISLNLRAICSNWVSLSYWTAVVFSAQVIFVEKAFAAQGDTIFQDAACTLLTAVLTDNFGAMITVIAGGLAILASAMGSFKGAWALLFVSIGIFIYPDLVHVFFPELACPGS